MGQRRRKAVSSQPSLVLPQLRKHLAEGEGRMAQDRAGQMESLVQSQATTSTEHKKEGNGSTVTGESLKPKNYQQGCLLQDLTPRLFSY